MQGFFIRWTFNCAMGELAGIGAAGAIAFGVNSSLGEPETIGAKVLVLLAMMGAGLVEGSVLGWMQWRALRHKFGKVKRNEWVLFTALVAVLGWMLGMLPSLFGGSAVEDPAAAPSDIDFSDPLVFGMLTIGMGLALGALFGIFQWLVLRKYVAKANRWILANALG